MITLRRYGRTRLDRNGQGWPKVAMCGHLDIHLEWRNLGVGWRRLIYAKRGRAFRAKRLVAPARTFVISILLEGNRGLLETQLADGASLGAGGGSARSSSLASQEGDSLCVP